MSVTKEQVKAGQAAYTPMALAFYDFFILNVIVPYIWRCPIKHPLRLYREHLSSNHLEIGVGSGYFLDISKFPNR